MTPLAESVRLLCQEYLAARDEDAMWLRGDWCREKHAAYERMLHAICRKLIHEYDWREWIAKREAVIQCVRESLEANHR